MRRAYAVFLLFFILLAALGLWTVFDGAQRYRTRPLVGDYVRSEGTVGGLAPRTEDHLC